VLARQPHQYKKTAVQPHARQPVATATIAVPEEDEICLVTDDERGAGLTAVAELQAGRYKGADSFKHQAWSVASVKRVGATVAVVD